MRVVRNECHHFTNSHLAIGLPSPPERLIYRLFLPDTRKTLVGAFFFMKPANRAIVQRSWGLLEAEAAQDKTHPHYGPAFKYDEFLVTGGPLRAILLTLGMVIGFGCMMVSPVRALPFFLRLLIHLPPQLRWLLKKVLPKPGEGPSESCVLCVCTLRKADVCTGL